MSAPFDTLPQAPESASPEALKRKKLWRNLFALNLCLSILLIAFFWVPVKVAELDPVFNGPSLDLSKKGEMPKKGEVPVAEPIENMLETHMAAVNASSENDWTYFDLSRGQEVKIMDPTSLEWDLAFRRGKVVSNGGATNKFGKAGLVDLGDKKDFDAITEAPEGNYVQDASTRTETENPVLLKWYQYNYFTHKLTPKKNVYALRTADHKFAKIQFLGFYCANKETGCIQFRYVYQDNGSNSFLLAPESPPPSVAEKPGASES
ncbi:MAG: HmuY family protein [Nitrospinae bacterium]|nr:HmuY family protein [Nitrospinota bacterium]